MERHRTGQYGGQKCRLIFRQKEKNGIGRRFLQCFQKGILRLYGHGVRLFHNINLIAVAILLQTHVLQYLLPHIVHAQCLFGGADIHNIRVVSRIECRAAFAMTARLCAAGFTLQCFGKGICNEPFAAACAARQQIGVGNASRRHCLLQMAQQKGIAVNIRKTVQRPSLLSFLCHQNLWN